MPKLSELSNRIVLSKSGCRCAGYIRDAFFDENCKKIAYFLCAGENGEFLLPFDRALNLTDAVMVENCVGFTALVDADLTELCAVRRGMQVFSADGRLKGVLDDVIFDAKGRVSGLFAGEYKFTPVDMLGVGDVILLKAEGAKRRGRPPRLPQAVENRTVLALAAEADSLEASSKAEAVTSARESNMESSSGSPSTEHRPYGQGDGRVPIILGDAIRGIELAAPQDHTPPRIIADYNFLLGRSLVANLVSYAGETLGLKGETVTVALVELARKHGKLVDLTLNSK